MSNRILVFLFCLLSMAFARGQSLKIEIESSIDRLNKATISQDKETLQKLTEDQLTFGHSTGLIEDKSSYIKDILAGSTKFFQIDIAEQTVNLVGNLAIVRNMSSIRGTKDGAPMDVKIGVLMIWKKEGVDWKLLARQGYKLP